MSASSRSSRSGSGTYSGGSYSSYSYSDHGKGGGRDDGSSERSRKKPRTQQQQAPSGAKTHKRGGPGTAAAAEAAQPPPHLGPMTAEQQMALNAFTQRKLLERQHHVQTDALVKTLQTEKRRIRTSLMQALRAVHPKIADQEREAQARRARREAGEDSGDGAGGAGDGAENGDAAGVVSVPVTASRKEQRAAATARAFAAAMSVLGDDGGDDGEDEAYVPDENDDHDAPPRKKRRAAAKTLAVPVKKKARGKRNELVRPYVVPTVGDGDAAAEAAAASGADAELVKVAGLRLHRTIRTPKREDVERCLHDAANILLRRAEHVERVAACARQTGGDDAAAQQALAEALWARVRALLESRTEHVQTQLVLRKAPPPPKRAVAAAAAAPSDAKSRKRKRQDGAAAAAAVPAPIRSDVAPAPTVPAGLINDKLRQLALIDHRLAAIKAAATRAAAADAAAAAASAATTLKEKRAAAAAEVDVLAKLVRQHNPMGCAVRVNIVDPRDPGRVRHGVVRTWLSQRPKRIKRHDFLATAQEVFCRHVVDALAKEDVATTAAASAAPADAVYRIAVHISQRAPELAHAIADTVTAKALEDVKPAHRVQFIDDEDAAAAAAARKRRHHRDDGAAAAAAAKTATTTTTTTAMDTDDATALVIGVKEDEDTMKP